MNEFDYLFHDNFELVEEEEELVSEPNDVVNNAEMELNNLFDNNIEEEQEPVAGPSGV